ncbi:MAG: hypothetical protein PHU27_00455 [Salinivirgaceae bacterium]|nr:hypothetical protein [Salinivirgaceae bacterium]MDD4745845.1 hypothetical protein [Salinivirgaceae bacterium]MDY0281263.1 hypothetical protein [Salinivirgaceae bacterium]
MRRSKVQRYLLLSTFILFLGCKNEQSPVPRGINPITINLTLPEFNSFVINTSIHITGGASGLGIVVYRYSQNEFKAYDRMCPSTTHQDWIKLINKENSVFMECPECKSRFYLFDGSVIQGPAQFYMSEYSTYYNQTTGILTIGN